MTRRGRTLLRVFVAGGWVLLAGSLARADAPPGQYGPFDLKDQSILDQKTGLQWQRYATAQPTFQAAVAACAALSLDGFGAGQWRLPSYKELLTLVDESPHTEYPTGTPVQIAIDGNAFPNTAVDNPYWSSSPSAASPTMVYVVDFHDGTASLQRPTDAGYGRCVHSM
jgi:hypothetical protein